MRISIYANVVQKGGLNVSKMVLNCAFLNIVGRKPLRLPFIRFQSLLLHVTSQQPEGCVGKAFGKAPGGVFGVVINRFRFDKNKGSHTVRP